MDKNTVRDLLLTGFKPREKNIDTPYLVTANGQSLDGELKLVALSGKDAIETRQLATEQVIGADGTATNKLNGAKFLGLLIIRTLYHRASNEPLLSQIVGLDGNPADLQELLGMDDGPFEQLATEVNNFLGTGSNAVANAKKNSDPTPNQDGGSESPNSPESGLSENASSDLSTVTS